MAADGTQRVNRLRDLMRQAGVDALVCRLPENVLYITDYWPHHGFSVAVLPRDGKPLLFLPEIEQDYANPEWAEVTPFGWGLLGDPDLYDSYRRLLGQVRDRLGLGRAAVGLEKSAEIVAPTYRAAEPVVPAAPWWSLMNELFDAGRQVDATDLLQEAKAIKTEYDLHKLRIAGEIAEAGIRKVLEELRPGMTEAQVGAAIERNIRAGGPGHRGARLVRAFAEVGAGPVGSTRGTLLVPSTHRVINEGDVVMVELATVVDGYWSDLTYMAVAGEPSERQREVHNAVLQAQQAAAREVRAGAPVSAPDEAARRVLREAGLEQYFPHITGHGVGFRYHEGPPILAPGMDGTLRQGMVVTVEPGVYIPDFAGIRIEDNVAVGPDGPVFLSTPRQPW